MDQAKRAALLSHLTPDQIRIAATYYVDHWTQPEIAKVFGVDKSTISRVLAEFARVLQMLNLPLPDRTPPATRHIRKCNIEPELMRAL